VGAFGSAAGLTALPAAIIAYLFGSDLQRDAFAMFRVAKVTAALLTAVSVALVFLTALAFITRRRALFSPSSTHLALAYGPYRPRACGNKHQSCFFCRSACCA